MADDSILRSPRELGLQKIESLGASPTFSVPSTPSGVIGLTPRSKVNPVLTPYVDVPGLQPVKTATGGGSIFGDLWASFAGGSNALLKMAGDFYGLATGDFDNWASNAGRSGQEYWEGTKSADQKDAESRRKQAVDAAQDELGKAWAYIRETVTSPRLLSTAISEQVPMLVVPGGVGAATGKAVLGQQLAKGAGKAAATAAAGKAGVAAAVGTGAVMQGADVGGDQAAELGKILAAMPQEQAMQIPEIAELVRRGASLDEAKAAYGLVQARKTAAAAGAISVGTQMLPGGRAIERALVGQGGRVGSRAGGAAVAGLGESVQEGGEEGGGLLAKNALAQGADPGRPITQNLGETVGQAVVVGGVPGAAAGFASARPPAPAATEPGTDLSGQPPGGGVPPQLTDQTRKQLPYTPEPREKVEGEVVDTPLLPPPGAPPAGAGPGLLGYTPDPDMAPRMIVDPATGQARPMSQQEIEEAVIKERVAQSVAAEAARLDVELGLTPDVRRAQQAPRYAVPEFDPAIHTGNPNRFNLPWQSQSVAASAARRLGGEVIQVQGGWAVNLPPPDPNRQAQDAAAEAADYRQATATPQTFGAPPQTGDNTTRGRIPFEDERLQRPEVRAALQAMSEEAGWEQQGGRIIREIRDDGLEAQVTGRTTWIGPDWYRVMQQDRTSNVPGGQRGVQALVKRALAGEPLTLQERRSMA
jgi:hypothetical protein